jgi:ribosomal protein S18 acetylase RimI-like enzyme
LLDEVDPQEAPALAMTPRPDVRIRRADVEDAPEVARLLHDFNTEFASPTPGIAALTQRARELLASNDMTVLLGGERPDGIAVIRFRPSLRSRALDAYLEELYVAPSRRGQGIGRALLQETMEAARVAGATRIELGTSETDTAAIALYESSGFTNREGAPDGPTMFFYERDL